ncbi:MAG: Cyclopentanone 1,2-monooxygenase [Nitrospira sp.]|nr:Cyclopentanone 1,2-monooxygenase [Nitrospira sp.]
MRRDHANLRLLFRDDAVYRDVVCFSWDVKTFRGGVEVSRYLTQHVPIAMISGMRIAENGIQRRNLALLGGETIEAIFSFESCYGTGLGLLLLTCAPDARAVLLTMGLQDLKEMPFRIEGHRPWGKVQLGEAEDEVLETIGRVSEKARSDEPEVLVIGAGHSGLAIAARLQAMDINTLVVDRARRLGDVWRGRYASLHLHTTVFNNHLPYLPFPATYPVYTPRDQMADWLEVYADALGLNVKKETSITSAVYDDEQAEWTVTLNGAGEGTCLHPKHIVMANGFFALEPKLPDILGLSDFKGKVLHSSSCRLAELEHGIKAVVVGTGNSGHDLSRDFASDLGADVTMIQRSPSIVTNIETAQELYEGNQEQVPAAWRDFLLGALPYEFLVAEHQVVTKIAMKRDRALIAGLNEAGYQTHYGDDESGYLVHILRYGGGFVLDWGSCQMIIDGKIAVESGTSIERVDRDGVFLTNGKYIKADLLVFATGYQDYSVSVRELFGEDVAQRVGQVWGYDSEGELASMFKSTGQPGLWLCGGSVIFARAFSRQLALQIAGDLAGLKARHELGLRSLKGVDL